MSYFVGSVLHVLPGCSQRAQGLRGHRGSAYCDEHMGEADGVAHSTLCLATWTGSSQGAQSGFERECKISGRNRLGLERTTVLSFRWVLSICTRKYGSDSETLRLEVRP